MPRPLASGLVGHATKGGTLKSKTPLEERGLLSAKSWGIAATRVNSAKTPLIWRHQFALDRTGRSTRRCRLLGIELQLGSRAAGVSTTTCSRLLAVQVGILRRSGITDA